MRVLFGRDDGAAHVSRGAGSPMAQHEWQTVPAPTQPTKGSEAMDRTTERTASRDATLTNAASARGAIMQPESARGRSRSAT
jgi:hypothetical protein